MFSQSSIDITKSLTKQEKKKYGIYFTPKNIIKYMLDQLTEIPTTVLEPSSGSGEFVRYVSDVYPDSQITAVELNEKIVNQIDYDVIHNNFLDLEFDGFDLIIGNPPYYTMKKNDVPIMYNEFYTGRPNIYILFIAKCLKLLNPGGILSFVLPINFLNCTYYDKLRKFIGENYSVMDIKIFKNADYIDTNQDTCVITIKNCTPKPEEKYVAKHVMELEDITIFAEDCANIIWLLNGSTTLKELGAKVHIGKVVWNQVKPQLTNDSTKTLLIYSGDIKNNELVIQKYKNPDKKHYIDIPGRTEPMLVVSRGYGNSYKFKYCLINPGVPYVVENHLICIENVDYEFVHNSFRDERTSQFIDIYFNNGAINIYELMNILPIYVD